MSTGKAGVGRRVTWRGALVALALLAAVFGIWSLSSQASRGPAPRARLALFTSLPIYWPEAPDLNAMLRKDAPRHWARTALEQRWRLVPLDVLDGAGGLGRQSRLLIAQPRALSPDENVALDSWVAQGGRLLLFADPALTADSTFAPGDPRRPKDAVLLSPILARWGLELQFDEEQPFRVRSLDLGHATLPLLLPGRFALRPGHDGRCRLSAESVIARCTIGQGEVLAVADAALLEPVADPGEHEARMQALTVLMSRAFHD